MLKRALFFSFFSNYFSFAVQFVSVLFVVRLLTPEEMGVFSIAASFVIFAQALRDFGVSQYIVQEDNLTDDRIRAAFSLGLIFGILLFVLTYSISSFAGEFYANTGIQQVLKVLSINFLLLPFGAISLAYLRRKMNFKIRMIVESSSALVRSFVTIVFAYNGFSYMSLAYGSLASVIITVVLSLYFRPQHLPKKPGIKELPHVFKTGWKLAMVAFLANFQESITEIILGKTVGVQATGYFSRAKATLNIFNKVISNALKPVALPYFSEKNRNKEKLGELYLQATSLLTVFAWPFFAFVGIHSLEVVRVLYGSQWDFSASLVSIFCVGAVVHFFSIFFDQLSIATGDSEDAIIMHSVSSVVLITLLLIFSSYGLQAIAFALIVIPVIRLVFISRILIVKFDVTLKEIFFSIKKSAAIAMAVLLISLLSRLFINIAESDFYSLTIYAVVAFFTWLISVIVFNHPIKKEIILIKDKALSKLV